MCAKAKEDKAAKAARKAEAKAAKSKAKPKKRRSSAPSEYNLFLRYGEFMLVAVGVLVFGCLVALGGGLTKFTLTAEQINSSASRAADTIANSTVTPKEFDDAVVVYDYDEYAELIKTAVKVNAYETPVRWEQSLFPDKNKRPDVKPLPVENLRARASIGAIMYNEISASSNVGAGGGMVGGGMTGMSSGKVEGKRWITVTGSIPIRKTAIYSDLSATQYLDDVRDQPRYISTSFSAAKSAAAPSIGRRSTPSGR